MKKIYFLLAITVLFYSSCKKSDPGETQFFNETGNLSADVAQQWYKLELQLIKNGKGFPPPVAARAIAYTGVALYESVLPGMPGHSSLSGKLNGLSVNTKANVSNEYNWTLAANASMAFVVRNLFDNASTAQKFSIDSLESTIKASVSSSLNSEVIKRSSEFGRSIGSEIFGWSKTDGGHQAYLNLFSDYSAPSGDGFWEPTAPGFSKALLPNWGNNRMMVAVNSAMVIPPPPVYCTDTSSVVYKQAFDVYTKSQNLTSGEKDIAKFWADGSGTLTPPGHNIAIALQLISQKGFKLDKAAVILAQGGIALNEAAIICWMCKFKYNYLRPVSYIRKNIDPNWSSFIVTPPFPAYTSGHSTFSGSMAEILTANFGDNAPFTDEVNRDYGFGVRSFGSFYQAAEEAAISRFYGGIHYEFDNKEGMICGKQIGKNVLSLKW